MCFLAEYRIPREYVMPKKPRTLDEYLERSKRSQASLARELGISRGYLSLILSGQRTPSRDLAARIARACGIAIESLVQEAR